MIKRNMKGMALILTLVIFLSVGFVPCFAQNEQITITTYYPSPFGVYNELRAKKMAIGDTYYNPASISINDPADLIVEGNVGIGTTSPHNVPPNGNTGNLDVNDIYLRSISKWASQTGGAYTCNNTCALWYTVYHYTHTYFACFKINDTQCVTYNFDSVYTHPISAYANCGQVRIIGYSDPVTSGDYRDEFICTELGWVRIR